MKLEGFSVKGFDAKKRKRNDEIVERYTFTLGNNDGDRITVTTENKETRALIVGESIDLVFSQQQTKLKEEETDGTNNE